MQDENSVLQLWSIQRREENTNLYTRLVRRQIAMIIIKIVRYTFTIPNMQAKNIYSGVASSQYRINLRNIVTYHISWHYALN